MNRRAKSISFFVVFIGLIFLTFSSCSNGKKWYTDFDEASKKAARSKKNIFLLFSGDDWDETSAGFKESVLFTEEFLSSASKKYVLLNLDFSQEQYAKTELSEDATQEQKDEAEKILSEYEKKEKFVLDYHVQQYPAMFIISSEGFYIDLINYDESFKTVADFNAKLADHQGVIENASTLMQSVKKAEGLKKVAAIDELYEATPSDYQPLLSPLFKDVMSLDKENMSGLLGKFELADSYIQSFEVASAGDTEGAAALMVSAAENSSYHLDAEQKQQAYYTGAYILSLSGSRDFDKILDLLQKAYDIAPEGIHAQDVLKAKNYTETLVKMMSEYDFSEEGIVSVE